MEPVFFSLGEVLRIHYDQIERYGGTQGIRDLGLLKSALAMPHAGFGEQYLHQDLFEMAAAYLFHIARNHPFLDGNKRTAAASAVIFLTLNGILLGADEDEFAALVEEVASGKVDKAVVADFLSTHAV